MRHVRRSGERGSAAEMEGVYTQAFPGPMWEIMDGLSRIQGMGKYCCYKGPVERAGGRRHDIALGNSSSLPAVKQPDTVLRALYSIRSRSIT